MWEYQLSFSKDVDKIVDWANQAVNSKDFINKDFLEIDNDCELLLLSALYFKNMWNNKYLAKNNVKDDFYLSSGKTIKTTYMKHSYFLDKYYDYGSYISIKDFYYGGYASITYLVPKNTSDNIYELTKDVNIFKEDQEKEVVDNSTYKKQFTVNLKTPKFNLKSDIDFKNSLINLGLGDIFNKNVNSFKNAFNDERLDNYNIYISSLKQRNEVEFNEDGTIVKSISTAAFKKTSSSNIKTNTLDVDLNQPFIYIIRDINDIPIFVGHVDNPKV